MSRGFIFNLSANVLLYFIKRNNYCVLNLCLHKYMFDITEVLNYCHIHTVYFNKERIMNNMKYNR